MHIAHRCNSFIGAWDFFVYIFKVLKIRILPNAVIYKELRVEHLLLYTSNFQSMQDKLL